MRCKRMRRKAQFGIGALISAALLVIVLAFVLMLSTDVLVGEYDDSLRSQNNPAGNETNVSRVATAGIDGVFKFVNKQTTIAGAIVAVAVILIIIAVVGAVRARG